MENKTKQNIIILLSLALMACNTANAPINNNVAINQLQTNQSKSTLYILEVSKNKGASFTVNIDKPRNGFALKANTSGKPQKTTADLDHYKVYLLKNASTTEYPNTGDPIGDTVAGPFIVSTVAETTTSLRFDKVPVSDPGAYYVAVIAQDSSNNNLIEINNKSGSINWSGASAGAPYNSRIAVSSGAGIIVASDFSVSSPINISVTPNFQDGVGVTIETNISVSNGSLPNQAGVTGTKLLGGPRGTQFQINSYTAGDQIKSSVAMDSTGNFVVVWNSNDPDGYGIQGQMYNTSGSPVGTEFQVNTNTFGDQINPSVAMDSNGDFVVVWQSYSSGGTDSDLSIQGQRYDSSGSPVGTEFQVNTYTTSSQYNPSAAMDSTGNFVVIWDSLGSSGTDSDGYSIQGQRYDNSGSPVGTEFQVNTYTTSSQYNPSAAMDSTGNFIVTWDSLGSNGSDSDGHSIQGQRYDSTGSAIGVEFQVNTYTTGGQYAPSVAMDSTGNFIVTWMGDSSAGDTFYGVQGQRFDSSGLALGVEFQINTYTTSWQKYPSASIDSTGNFVVTWVSNGSNGNDSDGYSIQGQRYNSSGAAVGTEFQTNTHTTGKQWSPSVAMDSNGDFVVTWDSFGGNGNDSDQNSIQGQRYNWF